MRTPIRVALALMFAIAGVVSAPRAQQYPNKPVFIIYPAAVGGGTSAVFLALAEYMAASFGQRVLVEGKTGGNGIIGMNYVATAPADGYTLLATVDFDLLKPLLYRKLPFDLQKDFIPVTGVAQTYYLLAAGPSAPIKSLKELTALARSRPGLVTYASFGNGSYHHLALETLAKQTGIALSQVSYRASSMALTDVLGGSVDLMFGSIATMSPRVATGELKPLAVTGEKRIPQHADVPTFAEAGVTGVEAPNWLALYAPSGTPKAVIDTVHVAVGKALSDVEFRSKVLDPTAWEPFAATAEQVATRQASEYQKWGNVVRDLGTTLD